MTMSDNNLDFIDENSLKGKVTLITGGTGGIGTAICKRFAELGAIIYICDIKGANELAKAINKQYGDKRAKAAEFDISKITDIETMYSQIKEENGGLDILINNAAVHGSGDFPEIKYEEFLRTIKIDLSGAMYCTLKALSYMKKNNWGRIIFTGAPLSSSGIPCPYLAGKSGFIGLSKYISKKYKDHNIKTFTLVLRHCDTPMIRRVMKARGKDVKKGIGELHNKSKTGKMINPKEVAELYAYFSMAKSSEINGLTLLSDGGITYL
ncbi:MAG: SDR family oxidoreductase [Promethearchaeota archaeon]|nr:MAG: SDR family oxidoreductase [Candidatus Lokiarchaeota archaeon]